VIIEYHRPSSLAEALELLGRPQPETRPLGGGTVLSAPSAEHLAAVDLQDLQLNSVSLKGKTLQVGAAATLQQLLDAEGLPAALAAAIRHEASYTLRQTATVAGALVAADGRSPFAVAMLALDATLALQPGDEAVSYGDLLALRPAKLKGRLITDIVISAAVSLSYQYVARTPADLPIISLALCRWPSGRTRLALGGWGAAPVLAMDGRDSSGVAEAIENALTVAGDQWATAEYRHEIGKALVARAQEEVNMSEVQGPKSLAD
jgi:CO/xanthine dehydrogenase FAD-binding subunit